MRGKRVLTHCLLTSLLLTLCLPALVASAAEIPYFNDFETNADDLVSGGYDEKGGARAWEIAPGGSKAVKFAGVAYNEGSTRAVGVLNGLFSSNAEENGAVKFSLKLHLPPTWNDLGNGRFSMSISNPGDINSAALDLFTIWSWDPGAGRNTDLAVFSEYIPGVWANRGGWNDVTVTVDFETGEGTVYFNGTEVVSGVNTGANLGVLNNPGNALQLELTSNNSTNPVVYVDDLKIEKVIIPTQITDMTLLNASNAAIPAADTRTLSKISLQSNKQLYLPDISASNVTLTSATEAVGVDVSWNAAEKKIIIAPKSKLKPSTLYTVTVKGAVRTAAKKPIGEDTVFTFYTLADDLGLNGVNIASGTLEPGGTVVVSADIGNTTGSPGDVIVLTAVYSSSGGLKSYSYKFAAIPAGGSAISSDPLSIADSGSTVVVYVWDMMWRALGEEITLIAD